MVTTGFDTREAIAVDALPECVLAQSLASVGVRDGDIVTIEGADGDRHLMVGVAGAADTAVDTAADTPAVTTTDTTGAAAQTRRREACTGS
jgi:hypothetical protein